MVLQIIDDWILLLLSNYYFDNQLIICYNVFFVTVTTLGVFVFLNFASAKKMLRHHSRLCLSLMIFLLEMILIIGNQFVKIRGI